jgi:hypothetical protein
MQHRRELDNYGSLITNGDDWRENIAGNWLLISREGTRTNDDLQVQGETENFLYFSHFLSDFVVGFSLFIDSEQMENDFVSLWILFCDST